MENQKETGTPEEMTLEEAFALLDQHINTLHDTSLPLEEAFRVYQEGMKLVKTCGDKIDLVDKQVMMINDAGQVSGELPPMNDQGAENR